MIPTFHIRDVRVHAVSLAEATAELDRLVTGRGFNQVTTVNLDFVRIARHDPVFRDAINASSLSLADGMPLVWMSRLLGRAVRERVTGVDLVEQGARLAAEKGYSIFLLGAAEGVAAEAAAVLQARYPGLRVAGVYSPPIGPFSDDENERMLTLIREARPDMLFVAFGAPKQDAWIYEHRDALDVPVCAGVGGVFNFLAGRTPRAPRLVQRAGLEWAFRLLHDPRRLFRRYIVHDLPLFAQLALAAIVPLAAVRGRVFAEAPEVPAMQGG